MKKTLSSLAAISILASPILSMAAPAQSALVKGGALNMREEASIESKVAAQYPAGTLVEVIASVNDTWAKVKVDGKAGFMMKKYLNHANNEKTLFVLTLNGLGLNMREAPDMGAVMLASYKKGTQIKVLQSGKNWSRVTADGQEGFMASRYLVSALPAPINTGKTASVNNPKATQVLNLREGASATSKSLAQFKNGKVVEVLEKGNEWTRVKVDGKTGYMMNQFLKFAKSYVQPNFTELDKSFTVKLINVNGTGIVNFRDGGSLNASIVKTLKVGTEATVTATSLDWYRVEIGGETGYVSRHFTSKAN